MGRNVCLQTSRYYFRGAGPSFERRKIQVSNCIYLSYFPAYL